MNKKLKTSYDAIVFDLDGTIIDSEHLWQAAVRELILSKKKIYTAEIHREIVEKMRGISLEPSMLKLKELAGLDEDWQSLAQEKLAIVAQLFASNLEFVPGFLAFYDEVVRSGLKTAIATNSNHNTLKAAVDAMELRRYFGPHIYGVDEVGGVGKPHPRIYEYAAEKLQVDPGRCLAIEDSAVGIASARAAGMTVIGVNTGGDRSILSEAHRIFERYEEIPLESLLYP